ncbi:MAG TPA: hypothetical protein DIV86_03630 [Alphaproteobacteria bacterium]|nr:hypothetical protein [Alphaproteobacteria bacterium]
MLHLQNKDEILESYLISSERLISLIERENFLLSDFQVGKIKELADEKETLVSEIEGFKRILLSDKEYLKNISQAQKNVLINTTERLSKVAEKNHNEVAVAMQVNHMVLEAIQYAVSASQPSPKGYGNDGSHASYNNVTSIKIDESI